MLLLLRQNKVLTICLFTYLLASAIVLARINKGAEVVYLNGNYSPFLDAFFYLVTFLGDGIFAVIICLLLLFVRFYAALFCFSTYVLSSVVVQILKNFLFADMLRPKLYLAGNYVLHAVYNVRLHEYHSFPSGHSATAMALAISVALLFPSRLITVVSFCAALMVLISRMYLGQHFYMDTFAGAVVAMLCCFTLFYFFEIKWKLPQSPTLNNSFRKNK